MSPPHHGSSAAEGNAEIVLLEIGALDAWLLGGHDASSLTSVSGSVRVQDLTGFRGRKPGLAAAVRFGKVIGGG
jgi:hypothetical protein